MGLGLKASDNRVGSTAEPALVSVPTGVAAAQLAPVEREARTGGRRYGPALALKGGPSSQPTTSLRLRCLQPKLPADGVPGPPAATPQGPKGGIVRPPVSPRIGQPPHHLHVFQQFYSTWEFGRLQQVDGHVQLKGPPPLINRQDRILGPGRGHADGGLTGASVDGKSEFLGLDEGGLKKEGEVDVITSHDLGAENIRNLGVQGKGSRSAGGKESLRVLGQWGGSTWEEGVHRGPRGIREWRQCMASRCCDRRNGMAPFPRWHIHRNRLHSTAQGGRGSSNSGVRAQVQDQVVYLPQHALGGDHPSFHIAFPRAAGQGRVSHNSPKARRSVKVLQLVTLRGRATERHWLERQSVHKGRRTWRDSNRRGSTVRINGHSTGPGTCLTHGRSLA